MKSTGDLAVDYAIGQSKTIQKCMHLDAEMAYRSLPKQKTLDEAKSNYADIHNEVYDIPCANLHINNRELIENAIEFGIKWKQEQDKKLYSEEDMKKCWDACLDFNKPAGFDNGIPFNEFLKQFKNK